MSSPSIYRPLPVLEEQRLFNGYLVLCGLLLLLRRFVPLALLLLAPLVVNIMAFHLFYDYAFLPLAVLDLLLESLLVWTYREHFKGILAPRP